MTENPASVAGDLTPADRRYLAKFKAALFDPPWWWHAAGRTEEDWQRDLRRREIANKCPAVIHDQPLYCELPIKTRDDGLGRCAASYIAHVLRPTGDPDRPWIDTGRREQAR